MTPLDPTTLTEEQMAQLKQVHAYTYTGRKDKIDEAFNEWLAELTVEAVAMII